MKNATTSRLSLVIGNSFSKLEGLTSEEMRQVRKITSYTIDPKAAYFSGSSYSRTRYLMDKRGTFPTGLMHYVDKWLKNKTVNIIDKRKEPVCGTNLYRLNLPENIVPYQEQLDAVAKAMAEKQGIISMPTGFGKSVTMAILVNALQLRTLIIVPNLALKEQITASFLEWFGSVDNVTIENIDSAKLSKLQDFDCLIIDEAHHTAAKTYRDLNKKAWKNIYYRFFFTATPFRSRSEETMLMESITGRLIYKVSYKQAIKAGVIVPVEAYYVELPKKTTEAFTWPEVYSELVVNHTERNEIIRSIIKDLQMSQKKVLCLVKEIRHGENIGEVPFVRGDDPESKKWLVEFNQGLELAILGTNGVVGEGVDTKPAEYVIIAGLGKSKNQFMQQVGRGLRKYPGKESCKLILFKDRSHKFTLKHFKEQVKILIEEYGVTPGRLNVA